MRKEVYIVIIILVIILVSLNTKFRTNQNEQDYIKQVDNRYFTDTKTVDGSSEKDYNHRINDMEDIRISRSNSITKAVSLVEPAVVSINVIKTEIVRRYMNPFNNPWFGFFDYAPYKREIKSIGSGVIFTKDGYIVTNGHVVEGATKIKVILEDGRQLDGKLVGADVVHDIAIVKITDDNLPCAKLGISSDLIIGEWAIAIGNPYGFLIKDSKPSVAVGVVSAVNRDFAENKDGKIYRKMIQTDASINPGNSGGPLVNIYGEVIGINTFIFSESGGSVGMGFSIPIDTVKKISEELIQYGKVRDIWFGFKVQDINPMLASYLKLKNTDGVVIVVIDSKGPAEKAGLKKSDIIKKINNFTIKSSKDAEIAVKEVSVGDKMKLEIVRNGKKMNFSLDAVEYK